MNRILLTIASVFFVGFFATSASAQKFDQAKDLIDQAEGFYKGSCGKAISGEIKAGIKNAKSARSACGAFRECKKSCRASKKTAKKSCKGLKGKEKRKCKKNARTEKRDCVKDCRETAKTPECKEARGALIKGLAQAAKALAKNPECRELAQKVGGCIKAAGQ